MQDEQKTISWVTMINSVSIAAKWDILGQSRCVRVVDAIVRYGRTVASESGTVDHAMSYVLLLHRIDQTGFVSPLLSVFI
jgi:hypothetical protein